MKYFATLVTAMIFFAGTAFSQQPVKEYKVGHIFTISLPAYMIKTASLNGDASIQYKNEVKEVYGFIIEDLKETLELAELNYSSITEFYDKFMEDFSKDDEKKTISKPIMQTKGGINFIEVDYTFYSKEAESEIYYLVGVVETKTAYYQVLSWCSAADKSKYKADFQKILYSLKD